MEQSRILLGWLSIVLVHASHVNGQQTTYDLGNGEFVTNPDNLTESILTPASAVDTATIPCCFRAKLIVYYDESFANQWTVPGPPAISPVTKVQELLVLAEAQNFGFSGLADVKYDIVAIDPYDGNFVVSDLSFLRTNYANTDTRNANMWLFFTGDGTSGVGTSGSNSPCHNTAIQQAGTFAYSSSFTDSSFAGMVGVHIGLMLAHSNFQDYFNDNQPFCLDTCCSECTDVKCSNIMDINNNPYQCLSEKEAQNWHKKCLPTSENYCRYTGDYEECKWTDWLDQDNPGGYGDYEPVPEGCNVQKYKVQEVSGGTIYDNVSDMSQCLIDSPYFACINSHQGSDCHKIVGPIGPTLSPLREDDPFRNLITDQKFCKDYRVKYCCGKPKPKCYCCPPELPVNECQDTGCNSYLNGLGECVDVTNPAWDDLDYIFDLSEVVQGTPAAELCSSSLDTSCCRCMKMKTCKDNGCEASFGGNGVCIDNVDGDFSKYDLDMTVKPNPTPGLCSNNVNDHCCSCFKKQDSDSGCYKVKCYHKGLEGICIGKNDPYPIGYTRTEVKCEEKGNCRCWIPCKDIWSAKKCKKEAKKGKCGKEETAANCCATCQAYLA